MDGLGAFFPAQSAQTDVVFRFGLAIRQWANSSGAITWSMMNVVPAGAETEEEHVAAGIAAGTPMAASLMIFTGQANAAAKSVHQPGQDGRLTAACHRSGRDTDRNNFVGQSVATCFTAATMSCDVMVRPDGILCTSSVAEVRILTWSAHVDDEYFHPIPTKAERGWEVGCDLASAHFLEFPHGVAVGRFVPEC